MSTRRSLFATALAVPFAAGQGSTLAQQATPSVTLESGVQYADRESGPLTLDVYLPAVGETPRSAVLLFHGGAWTYGLSGPHDMAAPASGLAASGHVAFVVRYRLTDDPAGAYLWPDMLDDAQEAVRWVRANADRFGIDPDKIAAYGHSAGGHLSSHLGTRDTRADDTPDLAGISSRVQAVISIASHYNLNLLYPLEFDQERINAMLGGWPDEVPEVTRDASPITWVNETTAPFLLFAGGADEMSPIVQTHSMTEALQHAGVDVATWEVASGDHFNVAEWSATGPWTLAFLNAVFGP